MNRANIQVDYRFPPGVNAEKQAQVIAIGQTVGSWDDRFAHREDSFQRYLAKVISVVAQESGHSIATIEFPVANTEGDISSLLTMIFGKFSMAGAAKVIAIRLPEDYGQRPKVGLSGIRDRLQVYDRPLVMAIFKPALGLTAADHGEILRDVAGAGLDIIKDDEILGNLDIAPTIDRLKACRKVILETQETTGKELLYAVNVTGRAHEVLDNARRLVANGANALLFNTLTYGWSVLESLAQDPEVNVPIFMHPALAGALCGAPDHGFSYATILGTLAAHAGADAVLYPAHYGSLPFEKSEEMTIRDELRSRNVFPVPSAGIHPGVVPRAIADYGQNVILNAGTGIMDHPSGPASGVKAFFEALTRLQEGRSFIIDEVPDSALKIALKKWMI
jgi:2,3-diketo-5-methylthiopentyl-1-phosphate enolase